MHAQTKFLIMLKGRYCKFIPVGYGTHTQGAAKQNIILSIKNQKDHAIFAYYSTVAMIFIQDNNH